MKNKFNDDAADWLMRLDRENIGEDELRTFEDWLSKDERHRGAFIRAQAVWNLLDRGRALGARSIALEHSIDCNQSRFSRRQAIAAASVMAVVGMGALGFYGQRDRLKQSFATQVGEISRLPLADRSTVVLNTDSSFDIDFSSEMRLVRLSRGEGWFHVAKDAGRPFIVQTPLANIQAIGTAFSVRRESGQVVALVTEGVVRLSQARGQATPISLEAGGAATISADGEIKVRHLSTEELERRFAWQNGHISLNGETLAAAAADFNRYNNTKISVDPSLSAHTVIGWFKVNDPYSFARTAALSFDGKVEERPNNIIISAQ